MGGQLSNVIRHSQQRHRGEESRRIEDRGPVRPAPVALFSVPRHKLGDSPIEVPDIGFIGRQNVVQLGA